MASLPCRAGQIAEITPVKAPAQDIPGKATPPCLAVLASTLADKPRYTANIHRHPGVAVLPNIIVRTPSHFLSPITFSKPWQPQACEKPEPNIACLVVRKTLTQMCLVKSLLRDSMDAFDKCQFYFRCLSRTSPSTRSLRAAALERDRKGEFQQEATWKRL